MLRVEEGRLDAGSMKRNARTLKVSKPERRVLTLDLSGREGEAQGDAFRQLLDRFPFWQTMAAATPGLTP